MRLGLDYARAPDLPRRGNEAEIVGLDERAVLHFPGDEQAFVMAPDDVVVAIVVEVGHTIDVPSARVDCDIMIDDEVSVFHFPRDHRPLPMAPQDVVVAVSVEVARALNRPAGGGKG